MDIQNVLSQLTGAAGAAGFQAMQGGTLMGGMNEDLIKALQATTYQTDVSQLTGGSALTVQSLDTAMKTTIQENKHFTLFNQLQQTNATNIVDEFVKQTSIGGWLGQSVNSQMGVVRAATGEYKREVGFVKFLMALRQVGFIQNIGKNIVESTAVEERNGALQLLTDANYLLYHGNSDVCPVQFDGIFNILKKEIAAGNIPSDNIYDMQGGPLNDIKAISAINVAVSRYGSWGRISDMYMPNSVQQDLNMSIDPAFRWTPQGTNTPLIGSHIEGLRLQNGIVKTNMDTFLHDENHPMISPFEVSYPAAAQANSAFNPTSVTVDATGTDSASTFSTTRAGNYYYRVAAIDGNGAGFSQTAVSAQVAISAGHKAVLTITASSANTETGYAIYRSRQNGTNAANDVRLIGHVAKAGATTTFTDLNSSIPGTVHVPLLNMNPSDDAIGWRQYQPMTKIMLPFGVGGIPVYSWFQFLFGYLRVTKPKHHGYIKNILPSNAVWRPFTNE
jgi:hypothetical protein